MLGYKCSLTISTENKANLGTFSVVSTFVVSEFHMDLFFLMRASPTLVTELNNNAVLL